MSAVDAAIDALAKVKGVQLTSEEQQAATMLANLIVGALDRAAAKVEAEAAAGITTLEAAEASAGKR